MAEAIREQYHKETVHKVDHFLGGQNSWGEPQKYELQPQIICLKET